MFSRLAKITTVILMWMISWHRLTRPLTSFKTVHLDLQLDCFCLIVLQATKNMHQMQFWLVECPRTQIMDGHTTKTFPTCNQLCLQMGRFKNFTFPMTIHNTLTISKAWSRSSKSMDFGLPQGISWLSVRASNVSLGRLIVAAGGFCLPSLISLLGSHNLKNSSPQGDTFVISTQNIIVS